MGIKDWFRKPIKLEEIQQREVPSEKLFTSPLTVEQVQHILTCIKLDGDLVVDLFILENLNPDVPEEVLIAIYCFDYRRYIAEMKKARENDDILCYPPEVVKHRVLRGICISAEEAKVFFVRKDKAVLEHIVNQLFKKYVSLNVNAMIRQIQAYGMVKSVEVSDRIIMP